MTKSAPLAKAASGPARSADKTAILLAWLWRGVDDAAALARRRRPHTRACPRRRRVAGVWPLSLTTRDLSVDTSL